MNLTVFQSDKGDCLLLTSVDGRHMLIDGGMRETYTEHVSPALEKLHLEGGRLDVVYVSHIDQDHISGVLQLMDDEVAWRIHEYQIKHGNPGHKPPKSRRPPEVGEIWQNAFYEQVPKKAVEIEEMLTASAAILSGSENQSVRELASAQNELVTSISEAIKLSRRTGVDQLGIPRNLPSQGKLMMVRPETAAGIKFGRARFHIIGPLASELKKLRVEWDEWLGNNEKQLNSIRVRAKKEEAQFSVKELDDLLLPKLMQADQLSELLPLAESARPARLGERKKVTTPNLASLMFYVEENKKTLLLTGDGHHLDILSGLKHIKKLNGNQGLHVDVLKVQHHGSEYNLDEAFCRAITADHYIFCGNGEHENPDLRILQAIADSRIGTAGQLSPNAKVSDPFKFWFNCHSTVTKKTEAKAHMKKVERLAEQIQNKSSGQMSFFFLKGSSFEIPV